MSLNSKLICRTLNETLAVGEYTIDIEEGWVLFENIAEAVDSLHKKGFVHRDLKPSNIFIGHSGKIKLRDYGDSCLLSDYMDGQDGTPRRGTELYVAPELDDGKVSKKVCNWSLRFQRNFVNCNNFSSGRFFFSKNGIRLMHVLYCKSISPCLKNTDSSCSVVL